MRYALLTLVLSTLLLLPLHARAAPPEQHRDTPRPHPYKACTLKQAAKLAQKMLTQLQKEFPDEPRGLWIVLPPDDPAFTLCNTGAFSPAVVPDYTWLSTLEPTCRATDYCLIAVVW